MNLKFFYVLLIILFCFLSCPFDFSTTGGGWATDLPDLPWIRRDGYAAVVFDKKLWVLGGDYEGKTNYEICWTDDLRNWHEVTDSAPWGPDRFDPLCVVFNDQIWLIAGILFTGDSGDDSDEVWSSVNGKDWVLQGNNALVTEFEHVLVFDDLLWGIDEYDFTNPNLSEIYWSADGTTWTLATGNPEWGHKKLIDCISYANKLWVFGGYDHDTEELDDISSEVWQSSNGNSWSRVTADAPWEGTYRIFSSIKYDGEIWILGADGSSRDDIGGWKSNDGKQWQVALEWTPAGDVHIAYDNKIVTLGARTFEKTGPDAATYYYNKIYYWPVD